LDEAIAKPAKAGCQSRQTRQLGELSRFRFPWPMAGHVIPTAALEYGQCRPPRLTERRYPCACRMGVL